MKDDQDRFAAGREFVGFLNKYTEVIELQLAGVRSMIEDSVDRVMTGINEMSKEMGDKAKAADTILESTYMNPDDKTRDLVSSIQDSVNDLVEKARQDLSSQKSEVQAKADDASTATDNILDDRLRRFGGKFSKHMEALSTIDKEVGKILFKMVSALSNDDIIRQKLEHITMNVHALQIALSYVLIDFKSRFTLEEVNLLKKDLLGYTYRLYTSEDEKIEFEKRFAIPYEDEKVSRSS